jgi:hypothetical protein
MSTIHNLRLTQPRKANEPLAARLGRLSERSDYESGDGSRVRRLAQRQPVTALPKEDLVALAEYHGFVAGRDAAQRRVTDALGSLAKAIEAQPKTIWARVRHSWDRHMRGIDDAKSSISAARRAISDALVAEPDAPHEYRSTRFVRDAFHEQYNAAFYAQRELNDGLRTKLQNDPTLLSDPKRARSLAGNIPHLHLPKDVSYNELYVQLEGNTDLPERVADFNRAEVTNASIESARAYVKARNQAVLDICAHYADVWPGSVRDNDRPLSSAEVQALDPAEDHVAALVDNVLKEAGLDSFGETLPVVEICH